MNKKLFTLGASVLAAGIIALSDVENVSAEEAPLEARTAEVIREEIEKSLEELVKSDEKDKDELVYVIQKGDTLTAIADAVELPLGQVIAFNSIVDANLIYPGQEIRFALNEDGEIEEVKIDEVAYSVSDSGSAGSYSTSSSGSGYYSAPSYSSNNYSSNYTSNVSGSEAEAKEWIAQRESGGSYTAYNPAGGYYGRYQLNPSLISYGASPEAQEAAADNYVSGRYGSWANAKSHWQANGWY